MKDFYEILGVSSDASTEEIRRAYRKKARELHPDHAGTDSEEAFKEVSVAYQTLSDPQKRQEYDLGGPARAFPGFGGSGFGFSDLFETMFGTMGAFGAGSGPTRGRPGRDNLVAVEVTLEDVVFGTQKQVLLNTAMSCSTCTGTGSAPGSSPELCSTCAGGGSQVRVQNTPLGQVRMAVPCGDCGGQGRKIVDACGECQGQGRIHASRTITVDIPAGVEEGTRIRLRGQGEAGAQGGSSGDLYVEIRVTDNKLFSRSGDDLHTTVSVPMSAAALGTTMTLDTFDGEKEVEIPAGTQPMTSIPLSGLGVGRLRRPGRGDLVVHVEVVVPRDLDEHSRDLLEQFAEHRREQRVKVANSAGFLGKLKDKLAL